MLWSFFSGVHCKQVPRLPVSTILSRVPAFADDSSCYVVHLFAGRAISGLALGALTHVIPMYIAEISTPNIRGSLVSLQQLATTVGVSETTNSTNVMILTPTNVSLLLDVRGIFILILSLIYSYM
jgi:MFS family permease